MYIPCCHHSVVCCTLYSFHVLCSPGIPAASLHDVLRATILTKITYCLPARAGSCSAADQAKLDNFIRHCKCLGYCNNSVLTISEIFSDADDSLTDSIMQGRIQKSDPPPFEKRQLRQISTYNISTVRDSEKKVEL